MFDTIEINEDVENGPTRGEYQTKDLECCLDTYILQNKRLLIKKVKYEHVQEEERTHPIFGIIRSVFLGLEDTQHHGYVEMYGDKATWKLKFTDGILVGTRQLYYRDDYTEKSDAIDCDGSGEQE